jgi:hypothetical protein
MKKFNPVEKSPLGFPLFLSLPASRQLPFIHKYEFDECKKIRNN